MDRPWPRGGRRGRGGGGWRGGPPWGGGGGRPYPGPPGPPGPPDSSSQEDSDRPPPGLRGRALGLWYRDRSLRAGGGRGGRGGERKYNHCQTLSSDPERETRIRSVLERAGRRPPSPPPPTQPPPPVRPSPSSSSSSSANPTAAAAAVMGTSVGEVRSSGALPTFLDVYGEECEADPRLTAPLEENDDQAELETNTGSMTDLSADDGPLLSNQAMDRAVRIKQEDQPMETEDLVVKEEITEAADRPVAGAADQVKERGDQVAPLVSNSVKTERHRDAFGSGSVTAGFAETVTGGGTPCGKQDDGPDDQQTPAVAADDVVGKLDPALADKYRHLTDSSFKEQFLANLIGNQDRDWDNLSYDPARDGLRRLPAIDAELLEQSGRPGPLDDFRHSLPAHQQRAHILELVRRHQVVVISGETGCGKTTQVVQYLLEEAAAEGGGSLCHVICTQPRRISAVTVAERVARERGSAVSPTGGGQVGYAIRLDHRQPRQQGSILFCTTGVLLQRMQTEPTLARVSHLVIDEVHERDTLNDFLITIVKGILPTRPDLKVILMSATINSAEFSAYFSDCPMAHIPGRAFPVEPFYLEDVLQMTGFQFVPGGGSQGGGRPRRRQHESAEQLAEFRQLMDPYLRQLSCAPERQYAEHVLRSLSLPDSEQFEPDLFVAVVRHICLREQPREGAILVFLSGWDEIGKVHKALKEDPVIGDGSRYLILPLHSMMPTIEQREVFERPPPGQRKIIVATNIAETSITIDDVVFVVDGGKIKMKNVDKNRNVGCMTLKPEWVSKANSRQRRGRAGRVQPGKCYHLYSRAREAALADYPVPEILRTRLEELCLQIKILRLGAVAPFLSRAMDQPSAVAVSLSLEMLRRLRALDADEHLTPLGFHLARLPMDPQTGKMLIMAALFSCLDPVLTVASCLSFKEPFVIPLGSERQADAARERLSEGLHSDHMTMVNAYNLWTSARDRRAFARQNFLSGSTLEMIRGMRQQFLEQLNKLQFVGGTDACHPSLNVNSDNFAVVRAVISSGLYPNVIYARPSKHRTIYYTPDGRVSLHPKCVLSRATSLPGHWLVYKLKIKSSSVTIHDCSLVSPYQLLLFGERLDVVEAEEAGQPPLIATDAFVRFKCPRQTAQLIQSLRSELDAIISLRLSDPGQTDWRRPSHERDVLRLIVELVTSDDIPPAEGSPWCEAFRRQRESGVDNPTAKQRRTADSDQGSWRNGGERDSGRNNGPKDWWDGNPPAGGRENWRGGERDSRTDGDRVAARNSNGQNWGDSQRGSWRDNGRGWRDGDRPSRYGDRNGDRNSGRDDGRDYGGRDGGRDAGRPWNRGEPAGGGGEWNRRQYSWQGDRDRPARHNDGRPWKDAGAGGGGRR